MIQFRPTTHDSRFRVITIDADRLDATIAKDGFPFHIGAGGRTDGRLPWQVQAHHVERYCDRFAGIVVDGIAARAVVRLSDNDEIASGRAAITVVTGMETIAALRDAGVSMIDVEVLWQEAAEIEARLV